MLGKSHMIREVTRQETDLVARQPTQKWKQYRSWQLDFHNPHVNHSHLLYHTILGAKKCELCNAGIRAKLSQMMMNSCYEIQLSLKRIITLNFQVQYISNIHYKSGIMSNFKVQL
jgi:hypothetical protein